VFNLNPSGTITSYGSKSDFDITSTMDILNMTHVNKNLTWTRVINSMTTGWQNTVCDPDLCRQPTTNTASFSLGADSIKEFVMHFYPNGNNGSASVTLYVYDATDSANTVMARTFNCSTSSGIKEVKASKVSIYPNPATNFIYINATENINNATISIFNILGQNISSQNFNLLSGAKSEIVVSNLKKGSYFIKIFDAQNKELYSKMLIKN
jgi:hypothetical protein